MGFCGGVQLRMPLKTSTLGFMLCGYGQMCRYLKNVSGVFFPIDIGFK